MRPKLDFSICLFALSRVALLRAQLVLHGFLHVGAAFFWEKVLRGMHGMQGDGWCGGVVVGASVAFSFIFALISLEAAALVKAKWRII